MSFLCLAAVVALVRWSLWWPHRDTRQILATFGAVGIGALGLVALGRVVSTLPREWRSALAGLLIAAVLLGATVGFAVLEMATESSR